ncbi:hypothetical protein J4429_04465 [Candidatus Pacearchaeota archaeon]|nr:hypothetical protein [Candidatus Pacearchaeota archaeon]
MPFVLSREREGFPIIAYQLDLDDRPILSSVLVVGVSASSPTNKTKISFQGDKYVFLRTELLTEKNYDPEKSQLSIYEANRLRKYLRTQFKVEGLEGEL